jgi:hypothetical protein
VTDTCVRRAEEADRIVKRITEVCCENNVWYTIEEQVKVKHGRPEVDQIVVSMSVKIRNH